MISENPVIEIQNITKSFNNTNLILDDISFKIYKNEILTILGKSGCGKSTLFKILIGIYKPDKGTILYQNEELKGNIILKHLKEVVGFVSQENSFYEKLTIHENLFFFGKVYKLKNKEIEYRIKYLLDLVNLTPYKDTIVEKLSGGMKRRVEFAISLIHNPEILILDEPFTGLDPELKDEIWNIIHKIKKTHVAVIISTHELSNIKNKIDKVIILNNKKIKAKFNSSQIPHNVDLEKIFKHTIHKQ